MAKKDEGSEEPKNAVKNPDPPAATGGRVRQDTSGGVVWQPTGNGPRDRSGSPAPVVPPVVEETDPAGSEEEEPLGGDESLSDIGDCPDCSEDVLCEIHFDG